MNSKKVSVIIPAYNQAEFLGDAIKSVLRQTYHNFELIIVNDASPDRTSEVVKQFDDPRIMYLIHDRNKMLPATRNTGIRASSGEYIALLDADDYFHPMKLEKHVAFLDANPSIGVAYNPRFVLNHSRDTIRELIYPPQKVSLGDLVLGFPFAPSDMVIRRDWILRVGLFDETFTSFSEDLDINCQLALAGCEFGSVDSALNYRRYHSERKISNIPGRFDGVLRALNKVFSDPRCPASVLALRNQALINFYLGWGYIAFSQAETELGQRYFQEALQLDPSLIQGTPNELLHFLVDNCVADENLDHTEQLNKVIDQLPVALQQFVNQYDWAIPRGYLIKAFSAIMWGRMEDGRRYFAEAQRLGGNIDEPFLQKVCYQLLNYEKEFGVSATRGIIQRLLPYIKLIGGRGGVRKFQGIFYFNHVLSSYQNNENQKIPGEVLLTLWSEPRLLRNRGLWSILLRSLLNKKFKPSGVSRNS